MFNKSRRKVYFINPKFQLSFMLFSALTSLLGISIFFVSIKYFFWTFENMGAKFGIPENHIFFKFISDQNHNMNVIFFIASVMVLLISIVGSLLLSHRVAGPIYRMTAHLKDISSKKELKEVKFRKGDFFMELQEAFNNFVKRTGEVD